MVRSSLFFVAACTHAVCFGGGDKEMEHGNPIVVAQPKIVSIKTVYEKICECIPGEPRRQLLLQHSATEYYYLIGDLEKKHAQLPESYKRAEVMKKFCALPDDESLEKCVALLKMLMSKVQADIRTRQIYGNTEGKIWYYTGPFLF